MGWIDKKPYVAPHKCPTPELFEDRMMWTSPPGHYVAGPGSTWGCDECETAWVVVEDHGDLKWMASGGKTRLVGS